jgi:hypothetical protein
MSFPDNLAFVAFSTPFWLVGGWLAYYYLYWFRVTTYLKIENQTVEYVELVFGKKISHQKPIDRSAIWKLAFTPKYHSYDADGDRREYPVQFQINAGSQEIILGGFGSRIDNEAEIEWLAHEISDWLDIPLTIIDCYSDSKVSLVQPSAAQSRAQLLKDISTETRFQYLATDIVHFQVQPDVHQDGQIGHKTKVHKSPSSLTIEIASSLSKSFLYFMVISALVWGGPIWWLTFRQNPFLSIPFLCGEVLIVLKSCHYIYSYWHRSYLHIENQTISFSETLFGRSFEIPRNLHRSEIPQLTLTCKYWQYSIDGKSRQEKPTEFLIDFKAKPINLGGIGNEAEVIWLATEISELLDIPLEIVKPS